MLDAGIAEDKFKEIDKEIRAVVSEAADFAESAPEPDLPELYTDVLVEQYLDGDRIEEAGAVADDGGRHACQVAREGGRRSPIGRYPRRDRDRQGDDGIRSHR